MERIMQHLADLNWIAVIVAALAGYFPARSGIRRSASYGRGRGNWESTSIIRHPASILA